MIFDLSKLELSNFQIFKHSFSLLVNNFKFYSLIVLLFNLPLYLALYILDFSIDDLTKFKLNEILILILLSIIVSIGDIFIIAATSKISKSKSFTFNSIFHSYKSRIFPYLTTSLLFIFFAQGLAMMLIIPGVLFAIYCLFYGQVVILRNYSLYEALVYSYEIVFKKWWKVFIGLILLGLFYMILELITEIVLITNDSKFFEFLIDYLKLIPGTISTIFLTNLFLNLEATNNN